MVQLVSNMQDLDGDGQMNFEEFCLMMTGEQVTTYSSSNLKVFLD